MKTQSKIKIICVLDSKLTIGLASIRENMGHNDSLPYEAEVFIRDLDSSPNFQKVANIWNDGWGGESQMKLTDNSDQARDYIQRVKDICKTHTIIYDGRELGPYDIKFLCNVMAEGYLMENKGFQQVCEDTKVVFINFLLDKIGEKPLSVNKRVSLDTYDRICDDYYKTYYNVLTVFKEDDDVLIRIADKDGDEEECYLRDFSLSDIISIVGVCDKHLQGLD